MACKIYLKAFFFFLNKKACQFRWVRGRYGRQPGEFAEWQVADDGWHIGFRKGSQKCLEMKLER